MSFLTLQTAANSVSFQLDIWIHVLTIHEPSTLPQPLDWPSGIWAQHDKPENERPIQTPSQRHDTKKKPPNPVSRTPCSALRLRHLSGFPHECDVLDCAGDPLLENFPDLALEFVRLPVFCSPEIEKAPKLLVELGLQLLEGFGCSLDIASACQIIRHLFQVAGLRLNSPGLEPAAS